MDKSNKKWKLANPDKVKAIKKSWRDRNKKHLAELMATRRRQKPDENKRQCSKYRASHRVEGILDRAERRAREFGVPGTHTKVELEALFAKQSGTCAYALINPWCTKDLSKEYTRDHVVPLSRTELSPTNSIENIVLVCRQCNGSKSTKTVDEWKAFLERVMAVA